ncbi:MAG: hypothetical protein Q4C98_03790 [Capnocytophaga sp.]|nr:hypothetical protein [Capnocytophaga sp.]
MFKKIITYSFLFIYLFSFPEVREVVKLPVFIQHFVKHRAEAPDMSLAEFLHLHYVNNAVDADFEEDMKLPFKSMEKSISVNSVYLIEPQIVTFEKIEIFVDKKSNFSYIEAGTHWSENAVFRPPIFA